MKEQIASLETQVALMKNDILSLKGKEAELPLWVKRIAIATLFTIFSQTISVVWWASSLASNVEHLAKEVSLNTQFRMEFPKMHEEVMVKLAIIEVQNKLTQEFIKQIKEN